MSECVCVYGSMCSLGKQHYNDIISGNQITFRSNVRQDQIAFEVVYEKRKIRFYGAFRQHLMEYVQLH